MALGPELVGALAHEVLLDAPVVERFEDGVLDLDEVHLVTHSSLCMRERGIVCAHTRKRFGGLGWELKGHTLIRVHKAVLEDECQSKALVVAAPREHLAREEAGDTLLGHVGERVVVEGPDVPHDLALRVRRAHRESNARDPHVVVRDERDDHPRQERVLANVCLGQIVVLGRVPECINE